MKQSATRGPAPSRWHKCLVCNGDGVDRFRRACSECSGRGRVHVDDYTNERVGSAESGLLVRVETVRCDRCGGDGAYKFHRCELCGGTGRRSVTRDEEQERERRQLDEGSLIPEPWWTLCLWLDRLRLFAPRSSTLVWAVHVTKRTPASTLAGGERWAMNEALLWLAARTPDDLEVPSWARHAATAETRPPKGRWANGHNLANRDSEIRKLIRQGKPQQWIARQYGLTPARVSQLKRAAEANGFRPMAD